MFLSVAVIRQASLYRSAGALAWFWATGQVIVNPFDPTLLPPLYTHTHTDHTQQQGR